MDILIKSFNRPYYLARCIQSIYDNVQDDKVSITVLDDGTPEKYLKKIGTKFPDVVVLKSKFYTQKSEAIEKEIHLEISEIPIDLWLSAAENATEHFLLLEDDIWFTQKINLKNTKGIMVQNNIYFLKLFWLNNPKLIRGETKKLIDNILVYEPLVFTKNPFLYRLIFGMRRSGIQKVMRFLNIYSTERALEYYSIYSVAGVIFNKKYFLNLWKCHRNLVDENLQIINAVKFWNQERKMQFARTTVECVATGFSSSATNKSFNPENFDVFAFNKILNDAWLNDEIDVMNNFPADINSLEIKKILEVHTDNKADANDWNTWVDRFKKQFQEFGCKI